MAKEARIEIRCTDNDKKVWEAEAAKRGVRLSRLIMWAMDQELAKPTRRIERALTSVPETVRTHAEIRPEIVRTRERQEVARITAEIEKAKPKGFSDKPKPHPEKPKCTCAKCVEWMRGL